MALAPTLAQGVEPPEHRRRPPINNNREEPSEVELQGDNFSLSTISSFATVGDSPV